VHELPEQDCQCPQCGLPFEEFPGTEDSEQIEINVRAHRRVIHRKRYRPTCQCEELPGIVTAPGPAKLIPKGLYGISIWVTVLLDKYCFLRPTQRLVEDLKAHGLDLSPGTITDGLKRLAPLFEPVMEGLVAKNLEENQWHADETRWLVFSTIEGKVGFKWYLWVFKSSSVVVFVLDPSRSASVPEKHFEGVEEGILIVDRYAAYKAMSKVKAGKILLAFCWTHVRRDFLGAAKDWPDQESWGLVWVEMIGGLFHLNKQRLEVLSQPAEFADRDQQLRKAVDQMAQQRDEELSQSHLHPARSKALESLQNHWPGLTLFVDRPEIPMDNSEGERQMRPPAVARKIFYGSGALWAGNLAAMLFSLFATLRLWKINPRKWLTAYLQACADNGGKAPPEVATFLPWNLSEQQREEFAELPAINDSS
jgi:transposase